VLDSPATVAVASIPVRRSPRSRSRISHIRPL
jgi:hypothetical protein